MRFIYSLYDYTPFAPNAFRKRPRIDASKNSACIRNVQGLCVLHCVTSLRAFNFFMSAKSFSFYLQKIARDENPDRMLSLYQQTDDFRRQALHHLAALPTLTEFDIEQRISTLEKAGEALSSANAYHLGQLVQQHKHLVYENLFK